MALLTHSLLPGGYHWFDFENINHRNRERVNNISLNKSKFWLI